MEKSNYCPNMFYDTEQVSIGEFNTLQECMNFPIHNIWCINRDEDNLFEKYKSQGNRVLIICCWNRSDKWKFVVGIVKGGNVKYFDLNDLPMDLVQLDFESYLGRDAVAAIKGLNEQTIYNKIKENIKMNKKQTIRLNENQLRQIVKQSVNRILNEEIDERSFEELNNIATKWVNLQCEIEDCLSNLGFKKEKFNMLANRAANYLQSIINEAEGDMYYSRSEI